MDYELMHRNRSVALLSINDDGFISEIKSVSSIDHMPPGTVYESKADLDDLKKWWNSRSIPATRSGIRTFLDSLHIMDSRTLLTKSLGLSLSDQYWIRSSPATNWEDVNFFQNTFSPDIGNILFGAPVSGELDMSSPDNTSDGVMRKRWAIIDGDRCLIKSCTEMAMQEPFNEVIASMLMESLGIPHTEYRLEWIDGYPCSVCKDFVNGDTELVTAARVVDSFVSTINGSYREEYACICESLGIDARLGQMDLIDAVMMNTDRHLGNYGLIRDADTLEYIGPAPIYDTGTSLMCKAPTEDIIEKIPSMTTDLKSDRRVSGRDLEWVDIDAMRGTLPRIEELLRSGAERPDRRGPSAMRADALVSVLGARIDGLEELIRTSSHHPRTTCRPSSSDGRPSS